MDSFQLTASDGALVHCHVWRPLGRLRATVQIAHGMGEHSARYARLGAELAGRGYAVYASDHRGHGKTARPDALGDFGPGGWDRVILDCAELATRIDREDPEVPRIFLGHSMGAMLAQQFIYRHGHGLHALVLSGSPGLAGAEGLAAQTLARVEQARVGYGGQSALLDKLVFGNSNKPFEDQTGPDPVTGFEWLSRDAAEVKKYVDDPLCGFVLRAGSLCDLMAGTREAASRRSLDRLPRQVRVNVISGEADPIRGGGGGLRRLLDAYQSRGLRVDFELYPGARHELLNETNREQVTQDLLTWLDAALSDES